MPKQKPPFDCGGEEPDFVKDETCYSSDRWFPENIVRLAVDGKVHGQRVVFLEVSPLQCNPVKKEVRGYGHLKITLTYSGKIDLI